MENKICVYTICKNEAQFVDRWYESMKEADSIVVLDTGSTDDTVEKLRSHGVIVEVKEIKPQRFDVARNESLKLVPEDCNILICTDLDEILQPGWSRPLREKQIDGKHTRAQYRYIWSHTPDGAPAREFRYNKIHDRKQIWKYPVHELLWNIDTHTENYSIDSELNLFDDITLEHFPDQTKSRSSYLPLLELRASESPEDLYGLIYLAHEYHYHKMYDKSNEILLKTLSYDNIGPVEKASCYLFMGDNYTELNKLTEAVLSYQQGIEADPTYRECYLNLSKVYISQKKYDLATYYIHEGLQKSWRHYSWLERDTSQTSEPFDLLCLAYYYSGDKLKSLGCALKAVTTDPNNQRLKDNVEVIMKDMIDTDY